MGKPKAQNFHDLQISRYNCFFSEVREVSHSSLHSKSITECDAHNCWVSFEAEEIFIMSRGGTRFHLPMDQQVTRVFPLIEGILIEFKVKQEVKLHEILHYQRMKHSMEVQEPEGERQYSQQGSYCYATLTRHPFNPLKLLGEFNNQLISSWYKVRERVIFVSDIIPLAISYNEELGRNAFHALLANVPDVRKQYQFAFIPSHTYSLKNISEQPHHEVLSQLLFQQNQGEKIVDVRLNKSVKKGHVLLYAFTERRQLCVYEIDFYGAHNSTKLIHNVLDVDYMISCSLYSSNMFCPEPFKLTDCSFLNEILKNQIHTLNDGVAVFCKQSETKTGGSIGYFHNGCLIFSQPKDYDIVAKENKFYNGEQEVCIPPLIESAVDSFILRTLELGIDDERAFLRCLSQYYEQKSLIQCLLQLQQIKPNTFFLLHLLYQQTKLYELMHQERAKLSCILCMLAQHCGKQEYIDYHLREGNPVNEEGMNRKDSLQMENVYDIYQVLNKILTHIPYNRELFAVYNRSKFVLEYFQLLVDGECRITITSASKEISASKYQHGKEHFYRTRYPLLSQKAFHIDYFNQLHEEQLLLNAQPENKQQKAFIYLIKHHQQLITFPRAIRASFNQLLRQMRRELPYSLYQIIPKLGFMLIHREDLYKNILLYKRKTLLVPYHLQKPSLDDHIKTLVHTSTSQEYFLTSNASEMNKINNDLVFEEVDRLLSSSSQIKIRVRDIDSIPEDKWETESQNILLKFANRKLAIMVGQGAFCLGTSRSFITEIIKIPKINLSGIMPNDIKVALDLKEDKEMLIYWPEFHAGMTAGLKLSRHVIPLSQEHLKTWIFYQKPDTPKRDHSGFLLSLGLLGYLKCFSPTDIYQYLKPNNQFTSVAILLGVSASNIGKSDEALSKALILHIPVLLPPNIDIQIPINVQTSALIGIGLLHKGTCNRTMTEMALSQIGKRPSSDKCLDREGYSLAAGWALGMICLGMKDKKESFRDLQLEERLVRFIEGGKIMAPPQSMISTNYKNENKCSSIMEGPNVNLHITAPAALLAISLMYLKSNSLELSLKITIPNSFNTIEECNPSHILLKSLAKNLIMWDTIGTTHDSIIAQIPELIRFIYENSLNKVYERYYLVYNVSEIDYQTITAIYVGVLTGSILAMALKYAGTGHPSVMKTIKQHIEQLKSLKITKCQFANDPLNKNSIDQYEQFSLLSTSLLALAIVMAGSCDVECLKLIRVVRKKFQDSKVFHYGFSMSLNMAIGFVFLGFGNYTFNREDMSVAALLISAFPQFPNAPSDNKWHLQALRHFYVLAMQEKIFHAVDVDTDKVVNVATKMTFMAEGEMITEDLHTPILLQESKRLVHIKIRDEDYFDVDFAFDPTRPDPKAIYIKRKHFKDINPLLLNPQNVLTTPHIQSSIRNSLNQELRFTSLVTNKQPAAKALSYLLSNITPQRAEILASKIPPQPSHDELYYRLLKEDRFQLLEIYLSLLRELNALLQSRGSNDSLYLSNISFLLNFEKWQGLSAFKSLIQTELKSLHKRIIDQPLFHSYLADPHQVRLPANIYRLMRVAQVPPSRDLVLIRKAVSTMDRGSSDEVEMLLYGSYPQCSYEILNELKG